MKNTGFRLKAEVLVASVILFLYSSFTFSASAQESEFDGERIVHLLQEPRHRTVHHQGDLYLLDVQINPGDVSLPHVHDQPILLTFISSPDRPRDGDVSANIEYASIPDTHKVPNNGSGLFRIIALVHDGEGSASMTSGRPSGLTGEPQLENAWFRSYRVELAPGEETKVQVHESASVVIQVADGLIHVSRSDGITSELDAKAKWAWRDANEAYTVKNVGQVASAVVINEGR
ncbi:MAG: hypothetical protein COA96_00285 [SAR86 cluster bacterium]|uniref:Uncharacterized protein n=1 Tax=SAR86 cluster bacterium TaxID=2030880 RepID=A0A2A5BCA4_9GAMM|nr:MAG: hypothetical protein COA96_00285 [SAR86 cluster bacterium]